MNSYLKIFLCAFAVLVFTTNAASIDDKSAVNDKSNSTRISDDAVTPTSRTSADAMPEAFEADELTRMKRTFGIDKNVKREFEIKTKSGKIIKFSKSITYNDGGGLTLLPALIDTIGANRRKLIYALKGYRNCGDCVVPEASSEESSESTSEQSGGETVEPGVASAEASSQGSASQASAQSSSQAGSGSTASSQASAQASNHEQAGGSSQGPETIVESSNQAAGAGGCGVGGCGSQSSAQATAQASSQMGVSGGCAGFGCIGNTAHEPASVVEIAQGVAGNSVVVGGSGSEWQGAHFVGGGWSDGCTGDYIRYGSNGCICSHMMPVLLTPANSNRQLNTDHTVYSSPFSRIIKRHIRSQVYRPSIPVNGWNYNTKFLCSPYNTCCSSYRK